MKQLLSHLLLLLSFSAFTQHIPSIQGGAVGGVGHQAALDGIWSSFSNPAGLSQLTSPEMHFVTEMPFALTELMRTGLLYGKKWNQTAIGFGLQQSGTEGFRHLKIGTTIAKKLDTNWSIGIQLEYLHLQAGEIQQNLHGIQVHLGTQYQFEKIRIGTFIRNANANTFFKSDLGTSQPVTGIGFHWQAGSSTQLLCNAEFEFAHPTNYTFALIQTIAKNMELFGSISTAQKTMRMGLSFSSHSWRFHFNHQWQQWLGYTPNIAIGYAW